MPSIKERKGEEAGYERERERENQSSTVAQS